MNATMSTSMGAGMRTYACMECRTVRPLSLEWYTIPSRRAPDSSSPVRYCAPSCLHKNMNAMTTQYLVRHARKVATTAK